MMAIEEIDFGELVVCDFCDKHFSKDSPETGGMLFSGHATCPECTERMMPNIDRYHERNYIQQVCPPDVKFHIFVMELRAGNNKVTIFSGDDAKKAIDDRFNEGEI